MILTTLKSSTQGAAKSALQSKLTKALADVASGKGGLSVEDSGRVEELEAAKSKLGARVQELEEAVAAGDAKVRGRMFFFDTDILNRKKGNFS